MLDGDFPHDAVIWRRIGTTDHGRPVVSDVAEGIKCRWDRSRRVSYGPDGEPIALSAEAVFDREVEVGSAAWRGKISELPDNQQPDKDVMEVSTCDPVDDIRGMDTTWEVSLVRAGDLLHETETEDETP